MTIELITWLDAETRDAWRENDEMANDSTKDTIAAHAVGWVIAETDDRVVLAAMKNDHSCAAGITIPKVAITKRVTLTEMAQTHANWDTYTAASGEVHG